MPIETHPSRLVRAVASRPCCVCHWVCHWERGPERRPVAVHAERDRGLRTARGPARTATDSAHTERLVMPILTSRVPNKNRIHTGYSSRNIPCRRIFLQSRRRLSCCNQKSRSARPLAGWEDSANTFTNASAFKRHANSIALASSGAPFSRQYLRTSERTVSTAKETFCCSKVRRSCDSIRRIRATGSSRLARSRGCDVRTRPSPCKT